jgi:magnesium chelatase subunit D
MVGLGQDKKASHTRPARPSFSDIVGQEQLKQALLAVGTNDDLDGLLIQGEKGTAKSTAVRALAGHLPEQTVVADCPYRCHPTDSGSQCADCRERDEVATEKGPVPLVTLPLGATRERVAGTLSVADALAGDAEFDPGLLARANRGILYVDEINLLDDHLVDLLLDAAASGRNTVERDGVSVTHPAEFTLVGTMNPEEGELRPQLRDRFALQVTVTACEEIDQRVAIIDRAMGAASADTESEDSDAERQLQQARRRLDEITLPEQFRREIAELCRDASIDGHRGDIATAQAAVTVAALDGRSKVIEDDLQQAAELALPHRLKSRPFEETPDPDELLDDHFDESDGEDSDDGETETENEGNQTDGETDTDEPADSGENEPESGSESGAEPDSAGGSDEDDVAEHSEQPQPQSAETANSDLYSGDEAESSESDDSEQGADDGDEQTEGTPLVPGQSRAEIGEGSAPDLTGADPIEQIGESSGERSKARPSVDSEGPRVRSKRAPSGSGIDAAASVRAAAVRGTNGVESRDLRQSVNRSETGGLVVFAVDASASMRPAMRAAKGVVLELLKDAYQHRDEVAFVAFAGDEAEVLLPPTDSVSLAARHLKELPTGDRTPLPDGLRTAGEVLERASPAAGVVVLVTDGKANVAAGSPVGETRAAARGLDELGAHVVVIDASEADETSVADVVAEETEGERLPLGSLSAELIDTAVAAANQN